MKNQPTSHDTNVAASMHLVTFLKYFFPMANFFGPLLLWILHKEKAFLDHHGKQALNFQLSVFIYSLVIGLLTIPFVVLFASDFVSLFEGLHNGFTNANHKDFNNLTGMLILFCTAVILFTCLFLLELYCVINATFKASKGEYYKYPLTIPFLSTPVLTQDNETTTTSQTNKTTTL